MHDKMMKMMMSKKKESKPLSDSDKKSKLEALSGMRDMAHEMMGSKLKNLKKVTVASDSKPGLKEGLHKAESLLDKGEGYSDGGSVDELPDHKNPPKDLGPEGRKVGQLPGEFDRDEDHVDSEHKYDQLPRHFSEGGEAEEGSPEEEASESPEEEAGEHDSVDELVSESPEDPDQLDELIKKLEEKKRSLSK